MSAVQVREELVSLLSDVAARSPDFEHQRHISDDVIARFREVGVYRALVPKMYGGEECSPAQFCELIEQISTADGSAGWVASFGMSPFYLGALPPDTLKELYRDGPDVVLRAAFSLPKKPLRPMGLSRERSLELCQRQHGGHGAGRGHFAGRRSGSAAHGGTSP
jgi:hypothetical protein